MWKFALRGRAGDKGNKGDFNYVDRGDVGGIDFTESVLTLDGQWWELDLSDIVGTAARLVLLQVDIICELDYRVCGFCTGSTTHRRNAHYIYSQAGYEEIVKEIWVMTDSNGVIDYYFANVSWEQVYLRVMGWVEPTT